MLADWPVYAFVAATITGAVLQQGALHVGPLSVSQPLLVIIDPFASIVLSVWLFGERFTNSPANASNAPVGCTHMHIVTVFVLKLPKGAVTHSLGEGATWMA